MTARRRRVADPLEPALHLFVLFGAILVLGLSVVLTPSTETVSLLGMPLPPLCVWKNLTGMECLGCGLTRSFTFMGEGDWRAAFDLHMLGPVLFVLLALQIPWRLGRLAAWALRKGRSSVERHEMTQGGPT